MSTINLDSTLTFPSGATATVSLEIPMVTDEVVRGVEGAEEAFEALSQSQKDAALVEAKRIYREQMALRAVAASNTALTEIARRFA